MKQYGIIHFSTEGSDVKAALAEVFIRELKRIIYKLITWRNDDRYIDDLPAIVTAYNNRVHPRTGFRPNEVNVKNAPKVFAKLFPEIICEKRKKPDEITDFKYKVGDNVRIAMSFSKLRHGYLPRYSEEIYVISKILKYRKPVRYKLKTWEEKEEIIGSFVAHELIKVIIK